MGHVTERCPVPAASKRWKNILWICPDCGQGWHTTLRQPNTIQPTVISWWWKRWPWDGQGTRMEDN